MEPDYYNLKTHCHVMGATQTGKSSYLFNCMHELLRREEGFCLIDWHGTLYHNVLAMLAVKNYGAARPGTYHSVESFANAWGVSVGEMRHVIGGKNGVTISPQPERRIIRFDLSNPEWITPFNPFSVTTENISARVNTLVDVIAKAWGVRNTNETPTFERIAKMVLKFCAITGEPLHHGAKLLDLQRADLRQYAISLLDQNDHHRQNWMQIQAITNMRDWMNHVLSTENRFGRFIEDVAIKRFMGLKGYELDFSKVIGEKTIVLVNLHNPSEYLSAASARVFAGLLLSEFFSATMKNTSNPKPYYLILDEAQNYIHSDTALMLDQTIKTGLRMTVCHHHLGQDVFRQNPDLEQSLVSNARIKVVFGGLPFEESQRMAQELFIEKINQRWIKEVRYHTITRHKLEKYKIVSDSRSESSGSAFAIGQSIGRALGSSSGSCGDQDYDMSSESSSDLSVSSDVWSDSESTGHSVSRGDRYAPVYEKEETGKDEWSRDEKVSHKAAQLMNCPRQHAYIKTSNEDAGHYAIEDTWPLPKSGTDVEFMERLHRNELSAEKVDRILREQEQQFLLVATDIPVPNNGRKRKKTLAPQR